MRKGNSSSAGPPFFREWAPGVMRKDLEGKEKYLDGQAIASNNIEHHVLYRR